MIVLRDFFSWFYGFRCNQCGGERGVRGKLAFLAWCPSTNRSGGAARRCFCCWPSRNRWTPLLASDSECDGRLEEFAEEVQRGGQHSVNNRVFTYWRVGKEQDSSGTKSDDASRVIQAIADSSSVVLWRLAVDKSTCLLTQFSTTLCEKKRWLFHNHHNVRHRYWLFLPTSRQSTEESFTHHHWWTGFLFELPLCPHAIPARPDPECSPRK